MSTNSTHKYGFIFLLPLAITDIPMSFSMFNKGDGTFYTYNEYMALGGNETIYTPSGTHALFGFNVTSTKIRSDLEALMAGTPFVIHDGDEMVNWTDVDQSNYLWILSTEPLVPDYNYDAFVKVSPLFNVGASV